MSAKVQPVAFGRRITAFYCRACHVFFGKTLSVMVGEADAGGLWYGASAAAFIDWLLRDPGHCANQLVYYRRSRRLDPPVHAPGRTAVRGRRVVFLQRMQ